MDKVSNSSRFYYVIERGRNRGRGERERERGREGGWRDMYERMSFVCDINQIDSLTLRDTYG